MAAAVYLLCTVTSAAGAILSFRLLAASVTVSLTSKYMC